MFCLSLFIERKDQNQAMYPMLYLEHSLPYSAKVGDFTLKNGHKLRGFINIYLYQFLVKSRVS